MRIKSVLQVRILYGVLISLLMIVVSCVEKNGSCKNITTYANGNVEENVTYFHWAFSTPDFSVIYMDYELFWEIEELTSDKLRIYETYKDPVTVPGQSYRDYQQYEAVVLN